ncbi:MAG: PLP-dependent lyase/thiolase [Firmicutes bacterium]|nr:PLP-dependent lyase/thiolase [Bacillota bacterium]MBR3755579.1 PLP-dependent lyase/thiolase [Bacillota bacterium]MBR3785866.1 PLP-dependent lyase/thiolase [Bacillota bacterium]
MKLAKDYNSVMGRSAEIMKASLGLDFNDFESGSVAFDYEGLMTATGYTIEEIDKIQSRTGVGHTPLLELRNITALARKYAKPGYGARILVKDEAANASGSFKDRRAACAVAHAKKLGYKGVIAATSGNYGAAVASQAAMQGMKCIIVQECYDSKGVGQPEIVEKARKCEALGAEVIQLTVGPELFYEHLSVMEDSGYFNASLYSPFGIAGVETLGYEIAMDCRERFGKDPAMVVCTQAGGGMVTGTARGLIKAGAENTEVVAASIDLTGLHMASDVQFNKKSCTTGHTGFGVPHATNPDTGDVPRSAARPLRYMDRYVTTTQGEVMYMTEMLANLEGLERGPAGNTALAAAFSLAQELPEDEILVVTETEYTGAGKHIQPQLDFARENGIEIFFGNPDQDEPGKNIVLPENPGVFKVKELSLDKMRKSLIKRSVPRAAGKLTAEDIAFLVVDTRSDEAFVKAALDELGVEY